MSERKRINFTKQTKAILAERAGYRCSFLDCGRLTTGPGARSDDVSRIGEAAHIYSAAERGPRGRGGLEESQLNSVENGIWLCRNHAKLVDNNRGEEFPAALLESFKALHEARIKSEERGLYPAPGWLSRLVVSQSSRFVPGTELRLSKLNLLIGPNGAGKTSLVSFLHGLFSPDALSGWRHKSLDLRATYLRPAPVEIRVETSGGQVCYTVDAAPQPFNPLPMKIVRLTSHFERRDEKDDRKRLARLLSVPEAEVEGLVHTVNASTSSHVRNLRFETLDGVTMLRGDVIEKPPGLTFGSWSQSEKERALVEFAIAAARASGARVPTLLLIDYPFIVSEKWFPIYSDQILGPENQFQTIVCVGNRVCVRKEAERLGWSVAEVVPGEAGVAKIVQPGRL